MTESAIRVIAAALALPLIEADIAVLNKSRPTGDNEYADKADADITQTLTPLYERRRELRRIIEESPL
jgi:hypothetical protein